MGLADARAHQAGLDHKNTCKLTAAPVPTPQPAGCSGLVGREGVFFLLSVSKIPPTPHPPSTHASITLLMTALCAIAHAQSETASSGLHFCTRDSCVTQSGNLI